MARVMMSKQRFTIGGKNQTDDIIAQLFVFFTLDSHSLVLENAVLTYLSFTIVFIIINIMASGLLHIRSRNYHQMAQ